MYSLCIFRAAATLAVLSNLVRGVCAYPNTSREAPWTRLEGDHDQLEERAPSYGIIIPMEKELNHNTWTGYRMLSALGTGASIPDETLKDTAKKTYESIANKLPRGTALVSVVHVPGAGYAAGTIWQSDDEAFRAFAGRSPNFWHSIPIEAQGFRTNTNGVNKWHAEAVAVAKAETEFNHLWENGQFPVGTKIYTYGQSFEDGAWTVGGKLSCGDGVGSQVTIPCADWLQRLRITLVK